MQEVVATHLVQLFLCKAKHEYCITVHLYYHFQSQFGRTALQLAAQKGNNSMFEFLLLHGANIHHCTLVSQGIIMMNVHIPRTEIWCRELVHAQTCCKSDEVTATIHILLICHIIVVSKFVPTTSLFTFMLIATFINYAILSFFTPEKSNSSSLCCYRWV